MASSAPSKLIVEVSSSSPTLRTEYFQTKAIGLKVTNTSAQTILIKSATLKFQPDTGAAPNYVDKECAIRLLSNRSATITVDVTPTPLYREATNEFEVGLKCHFEVGGRLTDSFVERHPGFYVIINTPAPTLGKVFISFKQPEDQRLANILERYARRAGFEPRLFARDPDLGADQWKSIEGHIAASHSAFIVWARRTEWGEGVEKEVNICRTRGVKEILLIEDGLELPKLYKGTSSAYKRFDPDEPAPALSAAVASLRGQAIR
jgi:hypothetical protein